MTGRHRRRDLSAFLALPFLATVTASFIDMDTPLDKRTTKSFVDGTEYFLVMSDEFNTPNRTFKDGHDPLWTALDKSDDDSSSAGGGSLQFYNSTQVTTEDGMLKISTVLGVTEWNRYDHVKKEWKHEKTDFLSGMVQTWEKFCFTGGIVEIEVIFPGDPFIGGLWPAVWMLGNLGRATYESSTNNIWPWSYTHCNRELQPAQLISACNAQNHYGLNEYQGRGATEIDLVEVMSGDSGGYLPGTNPGVSIPYADMTLQIAPGVPDNRPQSGGPPRRKNGLTQNGHTELLAQTWYDGLQYGGNTSLNPFFYGTYLAETKPYEPVSRTKKQAFQADAVGALHQLTPSHFNRTHKFRIEWQPGEGGRLDWYAQGHRLNHSNFVMEGDGLGKDWVHAYSIKDKSLSELMGSSIPNEPTYLIVNTAISSTWGFPYDVPDWCSKCYDCDNPKCACAFAPGFCKMMKKGDVAFYVDSIRVYQSNDASAHVGNNHTVGCDPPEYPTKEYIKGHSYRYMRNPPFVYEDIAPLRKVQRGGGLCLHDADCGGAFDDINLTAVHDESVTERRQVSTKRNSSLHSGRGRCVEREFANALFSSLDKHGRVCICNKGFTGPHCLAQLHTDNSISAHKLRTRNSPFVNIPRFRATPFMMGAVLVFVPFLLAILIIQAGSRKRVRSPSNRRGQRLEGDRLITGRSY